ncbi:MAG: nucleotidyltransferase family protein [Patescibacteria group bacterium]|nr:nucleotidyltransferase family protein [Patescibacteria group bacterium]
MQVVILAAGKGTRIKPLSNDTPKPLIEIIPGVSIVDKTIEALPDEIDEIIFVVNYHQEQIRKKYGNKIGNRKVSYVVHEKLDGTAQALWQCIDILKNDFLVLCGDDIYSQQDLKKLIKHPLALLVAERSGTPKGGQVVVDEKQRLIEIVDYPKVKLGKYLFNTGAYKLTRLFFEFEQVLIKKDSDEYGLPQTLAQVAQKHAVVVEKTEALYLQINTLEDLEKAKETLSNNGKNIN